MIKKDSVKSSMKKLSESDKRKAIFMMYEKPEIYYFTAEELNNIEAKMSGGTGTIPKGTEENPCLLTDENPITVLAKDYWFACDIAGAVDFCVNVNNISKITIYKKKTLLADGAITGKVEIYSDFCCRADITISKGNSSTSAFVNNGMNKYFIHVSASETTNITCIAKQHKDINTENLEYGAMWVEDEDSARPNITLIEKKYLYVPGTYQGFMNDFVSDPKFIDYIDGLYTGVLNALDVAMSVCVGDFPGALEKLILDIADFLLPETPTIFKQAYLDYMYDLSYEDGSPCGLVAKNIFSAAPNAGFDSYSIERWDETVMYGCAGMTGTWHPN